MSTTLDCVQTYGAVYTYQSGSEVIFSVAKIPELQKKCIEMSSYSSV